MRRISPGNVEKAWNEKMASGGSSTRARSTLW
jgi:hypothetical protein